MKVNIKKTTGEDFIHALRCVCLEMKIQPPIHPNLTVCDCVTTKVFNFVCLFNSTIITMSLVGCEEVSLHSNNNLNKHANHKFALFACFFNLQLNFYILNYFHSFPSF
jgi:hypothetical protein